MEKVGWRLDGLHWQDCITWLLPKERGERFRYLDSLTPNHIQPSLMLSSSPQIGDKRGEITQVKWSLRWETQRPCGKGSPPTPSTRTAQRLVLSAYENIPFPEFTSMGPDIQYLQANVKVGEICQVIGKPEDDFFWIHLWENSAAWIVVI